MISFALWEEGILTASGNPKHSGIENFIRKHISIVNREEGSDGRALLDSQLKRMGIRSLACSGYRHLASGHLPAAWQVESGAVNCCLATHATACTGTEFHSAGE
ncbi:MAG: substrate-binding domain-containing protein [Bryobacteraceae bacterium]